MVPLHGETLQKVVVLDDAVMLEGVEDRLRPVVQVLPSIRPLQRHRSAERDSNRVLVAALHELACILPPFRVFRRQAPLFAPADVHIPERRRVWQDDADHTGLTLFHRANADPMMTQNGQVKRMATVAGMDTSLGLSYTAAMQATQPHSHTMAKADMVVMVVTEQGSLP